MPDQGPRAWRAATVLGSNSAEGPAFMQAYSAWQHRLSLTACACQLTTTMPPGYHRKLCCSPTVYPNSLTLHRLPQHKLNIKLGAQVMLLRLLSKWVLRHFGPKTSRHHASVWTDRHQCWTVSQTLWHWYRTVSASSKHFCYRRPYRRKVNITRC